MLTKPTPVLVIPGSAEVPGSAASTTCIPPPPASEEEPAPNDPPEEPVPHYLYVPNDPNDYGAGEVRTPWYDETPEGYTCSTGTFVESYPTSSGGRIVVTFWETRCYWEYPP